MVKVSSVDVKNERFLALKYEMIIPKTTTITIAAKPKRYVFKMAELLFLDKSVL